MINFFRNLRRTLLSEGKTTRYLKYALGEIVLVVVGILIALQINNWNQDRKDRAEEQKLLTQLQSEFESNYQQLEEKMAIRNSMIAASFQLLEYIDREEPPPIDSVRTHLAQTMLVPTFDPIVNDIMSSGRIQLLQNNRLKELLSLWTSEIIQVTEEEAAWRSYKYNLYSPFLLRHSSMRSLLNTVWQENGMESFYLDKGTEVKFDFGYSSTHTDHATLFASEEFEDHLAVCATDAKIANTQSVSLLKRISEILKIIEEELNREV